MRRFFLQLWPDLCQNKGWAITIGVAVGAALVAGTALGELAPMAALAGIAVLVLVGVFFTLTLESVHEQIPALRKAMELPVTWCGEERETPDLQHECEIHVTYHGFGRREITARLIDVQNAKDKGSLSFFFQWIGESTSMRFTRRSRGTIKFGQLRADGQGSFYFRVKYMNEKVGPVPQPESCAYWWNPDPTLMVTNFPTMLRTPMVFVIELSDEHGRSKEIPVRVVTNESRSTPSRLSVVLE